jgi:hypothetical protein
MDEIDQNEIDQQDHRGSVPFASGVVHSLGNATPCDSTRTRSNTDSEARQ